MRHRLIRIVAIMALGVATTGATALPAVAGQDSAGAASGFVLAISEPVPGGFASWGELFEVQGRMNAAAAAIAAANSSAHSGLGSFIAAPENRELLVYWHGNVPSNVEAVINQMRTKIPVKILPARFTQEQLLREAAILSRHRELIEVGPLPDASGLQVKTRRGADLPSQAQSALDNAKVATVHTQDATTLVQLVSRQDDQSPYYAGGTLLIGSGACTNSFTVNHGGRTKLLTAAHCGSSGASVYDGGNDYMGTLGNRNTTRDIALVDARGTGRMWDGPWNESSVTKGVQSATFSAVGNWLCTSGAASGVRCGIQVKSNNQTIGGQSPMVIAEQTGHLNAAGQGDSGGPVFEIPAPDNGRVIAKGIISAGVVGYSASCTGIAYSCYYRIVYADVTQTVSYLGATIVTG